MAPDQFPVSSSYAVKEAEIPLKRRAPTLYAIIFFKIIKGALFLFLGVVLYFHADHDFPQAYDDLINKPIFKELKIHPENKLVQNIADRIADLTKTERKVRLTALGTMVWSLFPLVEGLGMLFRAGWAGWLAIGESAFFVPIELYDLAKQFHWLLMGVTIANVIIVWYLYVNRETLFRHHHPRHPPSHI
jgi:uncharacterized membrane protein (DUF2068 family)